jgi:hypothetical protein
MKTVPISDKTFSILGSKQTYYPVTFKSGIWKCDCIGYKTRKKDCKHITNAKLQYITELMAYKFKLL